jgi:hypothetical protein
MSAALYGTRRLHHVVQQSQELVPNLSQMNPVHALTPYIESVLLSSPHLRLYLPGGLFSVHSSRTSIFRTIQVSPTRTTCPAHLILHFIAVIMSDSTNYEAPQFIILSVLYK